MTRHRPKDDSAFLMHCGFILAAAVTARGVAAQPKDEILDAGRQVLMEAAAAADKKDWAVCRTKAAGVWDKVKKPPVAALLGACEAELGLNRDAAEHLDFFLQHDDGSRPAQTATAREHFPAVRAKVALVTVKTNDAGVEIRLDGAVAGTRLFLDPGKHTMSAREDGFVTKTQDVDAVAGGEVTVDLTLDRVSNKAPPVVPVEGAPRPIWPFVLMGVTGAAGIGLGIGGIVASRSSVADAKALGHCASATCNAKGDSDYASANTLQGLGIGGFALAGASVVGLLVYGLAVPAHRPPAVAPAPAVGTHGGGVVVTGSF